MLKKSGFKITPENVDFLIQGRKTIEENPDKRRVLKNLYFEGDNLSEQTIKKLKQIWW